MARRSIRTEDGIHFLTITVHEWADLFSRQLYRDLLLDSLRHCQHQKGLQIHAWCIMSNHLHLLASAAETQQLSAIIRDFKTFTAKHIIHLIQKEAESRRSWLLPLFRLPQPGRYRVWQPGNYPTLVYSNEFMEQKSHYIHMNPVRAGIVYEAEHYVYSSAIDYAGGKGLLDLLYVE